MTDANRASQILPEIELEMTPTITIQLSQCPKEKLLLHLDN